MPIQTRPLSQALRGQSIDTAPRNPYQRFEDAAVQTMSQPFFNQGPLAETGQFQNFNNADAAALGANFIPGIGEGIDAGMTVQALREGNLGEAGINAAAAMLPFVGAGSIKNARKAAKKLYRASSDNMGNFWAFDRPTATAYKYNEPFGGPNLYEASDEGLNILDLRDQKAHREFLEETIGPNWVDEYQTHAWALEAPQVQRAIKDQGYDAVRYLDDYPNEADVLYVPGGLYGESVSVSEDDLLLEALTEIPDYRANSLYREAKRLISPRVIDDVGDSRTAEELDSDQIIDLLEKGEADDGDFKLFLRSK